MEHWRGAEFDTISVKDAYDAMVEFIEAFWIRGGSSSDDIAMLLSFVSRDRQLDRLPIDVAQVHDWLDAVEKTRTSKSKIGH